MTSKRPRYSIEAPSAGWCDRRKLRLWAVASEAIRPGALTILAITSLLFALGTVTACGGDDPKLVLAKGRSLEILAALPERVEGVSFLDDEGQHRVVRPRASNRQLALVNITVINRTSTVAPLLIDTDAAQLGNRSGDRIDALDPFEAGVIVSNINYDEGKYSPLLWGHTELERRFQVGGWMIFDVPKGLTLGTLWWREIDDIVLDFKPLYK